jgi:predicted RNase H-like nuclease (RuvC/YqgF family)
MANVEIELGPERLVLDDVFDVAKVRQLRKAIKEIGKKYDEELDAQKEKIEAIIDEYKERLKMNRDEYDIPTETDREYKKRIAPVLAERNAKIEELAPDDEAPTMKLGYQCLEAIAELTGQGGGRKVNPANFEKVKWGTAKMKLAKFLISNECDLGMIFLPPKQL